MQRRASLSSLYGSCWPYIGAFVLALAVRGLTALKMSGPENLDAEYYLLLAQNLVQGKGLSTAAIWHFLDNPQGFPHPAGAVWLPMASWIQVAGLLIGPGYHFAQIPQILLSSLLVVLAMRMGWEIAHRWFDAWMAALFVVWGGATVAVRHIDTDCYASYAVAGSLALYALYRGQSSPLWLTLSGLFIGLASLTRQDGHLLFIILLLYLALLAYTRASFSPVAAVIAVGLYLLVNLPWWIRNVAVFGRANPVSFLAPALLREYGEFFAYQSQPTWQHFLSWGWQWQVRSKAMAAWTNFARLAWVFQVWELPFVALGAWVLHPQVRYFPILAFPVLLHLVLSLVFTFPSEHGTFLHSIGVFVPFGAAFSALGVRQVAEGLARRLPSSQRNLARLAVPSIAVLIALVWGQVIVRVELASNHRWAEGQREIAAWIDAHTTPTAVIMSNVGVGVTLYTGRPTLTIPFGDTMDLLTVAQRYDARYLAVSLQRQQALPVNALRQYEVWPQLELMQNGEYSRIYRIAIPQTATAQE